MPVALYGIIWVKGYYFSFCLTCYAAVSQFKNPRNQGLYGLEQTRGVQHLLPVTNV